MEFEQLKKKLNLPEDEPESNWHRHENAPLHLDTRLGGWVQNTATVSPLAYVAPDAIVRDHAQVFDYSLICDEAQVSGNAVIGEPGLCLAAVILDDAHVSGNARIEVGAKVGGRSEITDDAVIGNNARICGQSRVSGHAAISGNYRFDSIVADEDTVISSESLSAIGIADTGSTVSMERLSQAESNAKGHMRTQRSRRAQAARDQTKGHDR